MKTSIFWLRALSQRMPASQRDIRNIQMNIKELTDKLDGASAKLDKIAAEIDRLKDQISSGELPSSLTEKWDAFEAKVDSLVPPTTVA